MKNSIFFEPPSRLQVLDKLKHMVRFSDFLLLISGEEGSGKSTLVENLRPDLQDTTLHSCTIRPEVDYNQEQLLNDLLSQLPLHEQVSDGFSDRLQAFYLQLQAMRESGQKCLIIVDDVDKLSKDAIELLLNLHLSDNSTGSAQLLLLMNAPCADDLLNSDTVKSMEGRVHHVVLDRMSDEETQEYISLCHPAADSLSEKKRAQLIQLSEGLPGRVDKLLAGGKVSAQSKKTGARAFPLPAAHMGGVGLILAGIFAVSLWQFFPEESVEQEVTVNETVSVPLPVPAPSSPAEDVTVIAANETGQTVATEQLEQKELEAALREKNAAKKELEQRIALQEKKVEEAKVTPEQQDKQDNVARIAEELREVIKENTPEASTVTKPETVAAEVPPSVKPVSEVKKVKPVVAYKDSAKPKPPKPELKKPAPAKPEVSKSKYTASENKILSWKSTGYTLQMLGARSRKSAMDFIAKQNNSERFYYFSTVYKGAPWHVVIYGEYVNRDVANAAIKKLPSTLREMRPWARSVRGVQIDIKKK